MVKIIADSGCEFNEEVKAKYNLEVERAPLTLQLGDEIYVDDQTLDVSSYIDACDKSSTLTKTAAPSPEHYLEGYKNDLSVFVITLSAKLSGSFSSAMAARQMYFDDIGKKLIHVFDSLSASVAETVIAIKINELAHNGFSDNEIIEQVTKFIENMRTYFILDKFDNLVKTGRMDPLVAKIASVLSIKPICTAENGEIKLYDKARGYKNSMKKLVDAILKDNFNFEERILGISHCRAFEKAQQLKEEVLKRGINFKDILIFEMTGLCSTYARSGGIIVSY